MPWQDHFVTSYSSVSIVFSSCQPKKIEQAPLMTEPTIKALPIPLTEGLYPQWADSIVTYRPVFGKAGIPLQPPFGSAKKFVPKVRLSTVLYNGKKWRTYQYDSQGRLATRTDFYRDEEHIFGKKEYYYEDERLAKIVGYLNKEAPNLEVIAKTNELRFSGETEFFVVKDEFAWIEAKTRIEFEVYHSRKSIDYSYLAFDSGGALIWQETRDP